MTWEYLATTGGAIAATVLITNMLRQAFGWNAAWLALAVAFVTQAAVWWFVSGATADAAGIALFNTFVVFAGATGGNGLVNRVLSGKPDDVTRAAIEQSSPSFWRAWV